VPIDNNLKITENNSN